MGELILGHLGLYYVPDWESNARALLADLGCALIDNGPAGFASCLLDESTANHHDNLVYIAPMRSGQRALNGDLEALLGGIEGGNAFLHQLIEFGPESGPHVAFKYQSLERLEAALQAIEIDAQPDGLLHGHVEITKFRPRPGLDDDIDMRMKASPVFTGREQSAFGDYLVQCFVRTDIFGLFGLGSIIELD